MSILSRNISLSVSVGSITKRQTVYVPDLLTLYSTAQNYNDVLKSETD